MNVCMTLTMVLVKAQIAPLREEFQELKAANIKLEQQHNRLQRDILLSAATSGDSRTVALLLRRTGVPVDSCIQTLVNRRYYS